MVYRPIVDRENLLLDLAGQLNKAARESDWEALARVDSEMALRLASEAAQPNGWNNAERHALDVLHMAHRKALEQCAGELSRVAVLLEEMRNNKDGWLAYAQTGDLEER